MTVAAAAAVAVEDSATDNIQPLSTLKMQAARVAMDSGAAIHASPDVLGQNGEDSAWVTVNFTRRRRPRATGRALLACRFRYMFANISPNFMSSGSGNMSFLVINQRSDYAFGLFSGGKDNPKLIAVSNKISFANPKAPAFPRLSQGKEWNEMTVTWTSGYNINEAYPFVEWRMKGEESSKRTPAGTLTYTRRHLCDGTVVRGKSSTFRASPFPGQDSLQRVVVFGDMGLGQRDGTNELAGFQPGAQVTHGPGDQGPAQLYDAVFHIGDLSYANGFLAQWDQFTAQIEHIASKVPYMVACGNHERTYHDTGGFYNGNDSRGECGRLLPLMFPTKKKRVEQQAAAFSLQHGCQVLAMTACAPGPVLLMSLGSGSNVVVDWKLRLDAPGDGNLLLLPLTSSVPPTSSSTRSTKCTHAAVELDGRCYLSVKP
uniref:Purple acid phosphatase n=1 Tax=Setaria viridis TaxID=4556 RepID=A0A4U6VY31_SETVI|nr:hypothetical protein SEVIR_2G276600v2 [Setaria viridis]